MILSTINGILYYIIFIFCRRRRSIQYKEPVLELAIVIRADVNLKNFFRYHFLLHEKNNNNTNNNREYVCNLLSCERVKRGSTKASIPDNAKLQTSIPTPCWKIPLYTKGAEADNAGNCLPRQKVLLNAIHVPDLRTSLKSVAIITDKKLKKPPTELLLPCSAKVMKF